MRNLNSFSAGIPESGVCYETIELLCKPDTLFVEIHTPDNQVHRQYPFRYQPIHITYLETGVEQVSSMGDLQLHIRYTPTCEGVHTLFACTDNCREFWGTCNVSAGNSHGYVGVSKKDPRYFAYTDGTAFLPLGINLCWPTMRRESDGTEYGRAHNWTHGGLKQYEEWMQALAKNGCNLIRIWAGIDYLCPETENAGKFDYKKFTILDTLFALAEKYDIKIKLTLDQFRYFDYSDEPIQDEWTDFVHGLVSKKLYADGERCEDMTAFFTEKKWKDLWLLKVREYALRYGTNPHLFAIELWNEINAVHHRSIRDLLDWCLEMAPKVQELFPNTMIINSLGSLCSASDNHYYQAFPYNAFSFRQVHRYLDMGAEWDICKSDMLSLAADGVNHLQTKDCPVFLAETGAVEPNHSGPFKYYRNDHRGILFADSVYTPLFVGAAGSGNIWHWDDYVENKNLFSLFQPLAKLTQGISFDTQNFVCSSQDTGNAHVLLLEGENYILGYVRNKQDNWKYTLRDKYCPEPIDVTIPITSSGKLTVYPLWESFPVSEATDSICFHQMHYGALFRIDK